MRYQQQWWSGSRRFLRQELLLEKGYEMWGGSQMFDTPSNLTPETKGKERIRWIAYVEPLASGAIAVRSI
jgi:hypothetical protein